MRLALAFAAVTILVAAAGCAPPVGTSLGTPAEHGWITSQRVGATFSDGMESLEVEGGPITLREVRTIAPAGVAQLGFMVVRGDADGAVIQEMPGFPPAVPGLLDGAGAVLGESGNPESWALVVGYRVDADTRWERTGLEIVYDKGGRTFRQEFPATLIVCGPSTPEADCWDDRLGER